MVASVEILKVLKGEVLAKQGDVADRLFVLQHGELAAKLTPEASRANIAALAAAAPVETWKEDATIIGGESVLVGHWVEAVVAEAPSEVLVVPLNQKELLKQFATSPKIALGFGRSLARKVKQANSSLSGAQSGVARLGQDLERVYTSFFDLVKGLAADSEGDDMILDALKEAKNSKTHSTGQRLLGEGEDDATTMTRVIESYEMSGKQHKLKKGEALCRQGDPGNSMFVVVKGKLSVVINGTKMGEIGVGEMVGEIAILLGQSNQARTADLVAEETTTVGIIPGDQFDKLVMVQPSMLISILARLANRVENNYAIISDREAREKQIVTQFLGKVGVDPEADYRALCKKLEKLIEEYEYPLYREFEILERGADKIKTFKDKYAAWIAEAQAAPAGKKK
jgi:CRP/FNR family cyclic AMP-dependent transcriptional regulator